MTRLRLKEAIGTLLQLLQLSTTGSWVPNPGSLWADAVLVWRAALARLFHRLNLNDHAIRRLSAPFERITDDA